MKEIEIIKAESDEGIPAKFNNHSCDVEIVFHIWRMEDGERITSETLEFDFNPVSGYEHYPFEDDEYDYMEFGIELPSDREEIFYRITASMSHAFSTLDGPWGIEYDCDIGAHDIKCCEVPDPDLIKSD